MAYSDGKFCPLCAEKGEHNKLVRYKINFTDEINLCSKKDVSKKVVLKYDVHRLNFVVYLSDGGDSDTRSNREGCK